MLILKNLSLTFFLSFLSVLGLLMTVFLNQRKKTHLETTHFKIVLLNLSTIPMRSGLRIQTKVPIFVPTLFWNYLFT